MGADGVVHVEVVFAQTARQVDIRPLELPAGATVLDALRASGILEGLSDAEKDALTVGVWGRKTAMQHTLRDRDRVEIYRPLRVDPKVARRERFKKQGARTTGLFAKQRPGGKAGY